MYCKNCGNIMNSNELVCSKCGTKVDNVVPEQPTIITVNQEIPQAVNNEQPVPVVNNETTGPEMHVQSIVEPPRTQSIPIAIVPPTPVKRKNPNTVLYIVLAVVVVVAIVCLTLVITQGN